MSPPVALDTDVNHLCLGACDTVQLIVRPFTSWNDTGSCFLLCLGQGVVYTMALDRVSCYVYAEVCLCE